MKAVDSRILRAVRAVHGSPESFQQQRQPSRRCIQLTLVVVSIILLVLLLNYLRTFGDLNTQQAIPRLRNQHLEASVNEANSNSESIESQRRLRMVKVQLKSSSRGPYPINGNPTIQQQQQRLRLETSSGIKKPQNSTLIAQRIIARDLAIELTNLSATDKTIHVFVHIPKSGGQSFFDIIGKEYMKAGYNNESNLFLYPEPGFGHVSPGCVDRQKRLAGTHCGVSEIYDCFKSNHAIRNHQRIIYNHTSTILKFITLLRDPVKRVASEYFYWYGCSENGIIPWGKGLCQDSRSFESWLKSPYNVVHNRMTKQLVMLPNMSKNRIVSAHCTTFHHANVYEYFRNYYNISFTNETINLRKNIEKIEGRINNDKNLLFNAQNVLKENFFFVGFQDQLMNSTKKLLQQLHIYKSNINLRQVHISKRPKVIDDRTAHRIRKKNKLDVALYRWAKEYFT